MIIIRHRPTEDEEKLIFRVSVTKTRCELQESCNLGGLLDGECGHLGWFFGLRVYLGVFCLFLIVVLWVNGFLANSNKVWCDVDVACSFFWLRNANLSWARLSKSNYHCHSQQKNQRKRQECFSVSNDKIYIQFSNSPQVALFRTLVICFLQFC